MPYMMLRGAKAFIEFCKAVFNAEEILEMQHLREDDSILHAEVNIGGSTIMFSEASTQWPEQAANLFVYVESADQTCQKALELGSTLVMELSDQNYGRSCGVKDPFGNVWWITSL